VWVDPTSAEDIAGGILHVLEDNERYEKNVFNALRIAKEKYNWEKEFDKLLTLYQELFVKKGYK